MVEENNDWAARYHSKQNDYQCALMRDTTPDRKLEEAAARLRDREDRKRMDRVLNVLAAIAIIMLIVIIVAMGYAAVGNTAQTDPVFEAKVGKCADYIGTVNHRLAGTGKEYEAARILVTASRDAKLGWGWELLAAIARYETVNKFNITSHNTRTKCYGLLQVRYKWDVHGATMAALGLDGCDPQDSVLYGAMMLAKSQREGKSLTQALVPWGAGIKGRIPAIIKEYENLKELYR